MGKANDSRKTKKTLRNKVRNLAKATNENRKAISKQRRKQKNISFRTCNNASKNSNVKKKDSISKNKVNADYCEFYYDFW